MSAFERLLGQVDAFIRKYYKNQIIKGLFLFVGVFLLTFLLVTGLEYFGRFNSAVRAGLFFGFLGVNGYILGKYIVIPLLKLKSFGKRINRYQASSIIGKFFPEVSDRLLNTLQLKDQMNENSGDYELLNASVQQRSKSLSVVPFADAIDLGENRRYLKWVLPIVAALIAIGIFVPGLFTQGTERVVKFSEEFEIPAPFKFSFLNDGSSVEEGRNFPFEVELVGNDLPEKVYVRSEQGRALLTRTSKNKFRGELNQVRDDMNLQFEANLRGDRFKSDKYKVNVISKTALGKMQATVVYPGYLGRDKEIIENASDITVPEGSQITWSVLTKNSDGAEFWLGDKKSTHTKAGFSVSAKVLEDTEGKVVLRNRQSHQLDTTFFDIDVIKDNYPTIQAEEVQDTLKDGIRYFSGLVSDDHGLGGVKFVYTITSKDGKKRTESLPVGRIVGTESPFDFAVDFRREKIALEDRIEYHFVVWDNDGVNGPKSSKSRTFLYKLPTLEELNETRDEQQEEQRDKMKDLVKQAEEFQKNLDKLRKESKGKNNSSWNKMNQVKQLQEEHQSLIENLQDVQEEIENSMEEKNQLSEIDEEILKQQEMIQDLLEELMDEELKELLEQLEELMKEQNQENLEENMEQLEMSAEEMKNQLDRSLEMLKRLQVNEKIDSIEEELKQLAEEQEELKEEVGKESKVSEESKKKQEAINEQFEELKDDLKELDSLNQELDNPMDLGDPMEDAEEVSEELNDAQKKMDGNKGKKAQESQQNASDQMKKMAEQMDIMQQMANQQQQQEDIDMLRNILESLMALSFDQEDVMKRLRRVQDTDPAFKKYTRKQRKIVDDTKVVADSLHALAMRQPRIASFIDDELNKIDVNQDLALESIDERERGDMTTYQQYAMTSYNNLALMLNESLQQMQQQMQSMMSGSGSCDKPGGGGKGKPGSGKKMSSGDMKQMLKKQLEQMKKGNNPGGKKPGEKPGQKPGGSQGMGSFGMGNKQIAKMAAEQSAIRKRLEQLKRELNKDGKGQGNKLNPLIRELEEQERDLVNKRLNNNLIKRQQDILTRLLESEKAIRERGFEEKRESQSGKNENYGNQIQFDQYNKEKLRQIELLRSVDPAYKKYYKDRANEFFNRIL